MGELTDLIFSLLGKAGRVFNIQGKRICFILWSICLLYWAARNISLGLKVQAASCFVSILFHVYGHWNWKRKKIGEEHEHKPNN